MKKVSKVLLAVLIVISVFSRPMTAQAADNWSSASDFGFGQSENISATKLLSYGDTLMAGTENTNGAQVRQTTNLFFPSGNLGGVSGDKTTSLVEFPNTDGTKYVYAGSRAIGAGKSYVFAFDPNLNTWFNTKLPSPPWPNPGNKEITSLAVFGDYLYAGTRNYDGAQIWRLKNTEDPRNPNWEQVVTDGLGSSGYYAIQHIFSIGQTLFASFLNSGQGTVGCRLIRSVDNGNANSWKSYFPDGLPRTMTECIGSSAELFGINYVGLSKRANGVSDTLYQTWDGVTYVKLNSTCFLEGSSQHCPGNSYGFSKGAVTSLRALTDRQLMIGTQEGDFYRACPSHVLPVGSDSYFYRSIDRRDTEFRGYSVTDIAIHKDNIFIAEGRGTGSTNQGSTNVAKVWRTPISSLKSFPGDKCGILPDPASLQINLPTSQIYTPDRLRFGDQLYTFDETSLCFMTNSLCSPKISVDRVNNNLVDNTFRLTIKDIIKGDGINLDDPRIQNWGVRLTYKERVTFAVFNNIVGSLRNQPQSLDHTFLGDSDCVPAQEDVATNLCLRSRLTLNNPTERPGNPINQTLLQRIPIDVSQINVEGNVAAPEQVAGFTLDSKAIAVGGSVNVQGSTNQLDDYIDGQSETFDWNRISLKLGALYAKGQGLGTGVSGGSYYGANWFLNSDTNIPTNSNSSTFSSPPEGKIWKIENNSLTLGSVTFHGAGTIVINGDLNINGRLLCEDSTRLGFIVHGKININTDFVGCGAYTALSRSSSSNDGTIIFKNVPSGQVKGIFIAKNSIRLPSKISLTGPFNVEYDSLFASNPTALYQELLRIVFTTSS
ncbi:MAG: hypothetical protein NUV80_00170 [Candidatus Berkelbacteria bacterium]|nr:hypothetical protein [Candidatus Berkelbacteria bacterium]MCR4306967.1 hypothetical protein [Candidatus Berkelbacteria bacterium]